MCWEQALYSQEDADRGELHGTIPRTTIRSLVRDHHLNFAQVEALNIDGFDNDSRLLCLDYTTFECHEVMDPQLVSTTRLLSTHNWTTSNNKVLLYHARIRSRISGLKHRQGFPAMVESAIERAPASRDSCSSCRGCEVSAIGVCS